MQSSSVFLSAGDPSGDNAAARLVGSLRKLRPQLSLFGLGGRRLKELGQEQFASPNELAVLGFWEVAKRLRFFQKLLAKCAHEIKKRKPACVVLVDYPGFNLRLAERIRPLGIPVVYYISPQVWAWGKRRIKQIRELVDIMLLILPFEEKLFTDNGIANRFVGHYLLEDIPSEYIASPAPLEDRLCLMPGSRKQEIERMLGPMLRTAKEFNARHGIGAVVAAVKSLFDYQNCVERFGCDGIDVMYDDSRRAVAESTLVLTASGTATLETAIIGRPMVVVYKTGLVTYLVARRLIKLDKIALVNLVLNERVVPELIQRQATPKNMLAELERFAGDKEYLNSVRLKLSKVPEILGGKGASERAATSIVEHLG